MAARLTESMAGVGRKVGRSSALVMVWVAGELLNGIQLPMAQSSVSGQHPKPRDPGQSRDCGEQSRVATVGRGEGGMQEETPQR